MKIDFKTCTEEELWKYVAGHLKDRGIDTVLVGGAVVSIYTEGAYESGDLDLILTNYFVTNLPEIMAEIGFIRDKRRHFIHPECKHLYIEFPKGPLEIGDDIHIQPDETTVGGTTIKILSPTDCVKDRLATYIHFKDRVGIEQALMVARKHPVNLSSIEKWCEKENAKNIFEEFISNLRMKTE
ncbi:nucleotidyltransferase [Peredibacter sp. HCB2-198]|uniref:nucleotidyltransferase n=1 Tax=Peredibacter sp. HCB2-198 TaxID=3383025 RepID=UPI0038B4514D